ncbi:MAG TPA: FG-GAP-like repeat-containing protein [Chryseolinea sp.]|nr:FG-GAP-like repeat-containing protein [Chryseolinea sp.]HPM32296.1 FG-GAP-like repeat-containing protein [Chryseolinea sp.]
MMKFLFRAFGILLFFVTLLLEGCQSRPDALFTKLLPENSGINFENRIEESDSINILSYEYTYNGGGVAAGDFNNDGLCDLYFTGNTISNRLYLNQGNLKFKDITESAGVNGRKLWKTGVTAVDINADGWLDLYVCYSGPNVNQSLSNQLFINNGSEKGGEPTFTESAKEYGLGAQDTYSTQASFFDYDRDGDLDMFLINHGNHFYSPFINTNKLRTMRHPQFGNRLYRNDTFNGDSINQKNHFTEVSQQAGVHGGGINFSLGVSISDINNDGWPDIYVTNDYEEQDFFYLNNRDGTFKDCTKNSFSHLSRNGMGTDIADFNNDGRTDLVEVDMWPEDNYRQKLLKGPDDFNRYSLMVDSGFHYQQMRNTLQMNAGTSANGFPLFCEVGQMAGVSATDWSWAPLFVDVDNDGYKDLFITNGYLRDFTSMDFLKYTVEEARIKSQQHGTPLQLYELVSKMPSTKTSDYLFRNNGDMTFSNNTKKFGLDLPNLSFGAAYADLDNDGDLDLITNNTNEKASIWLNHSDTNNSNHYLQIQLQGPASNPLGIGAKVFIVTGKSMQLQEQFLARGYQSSVDPVLHFGLSKKNSVDTVRVIWPDGKESMLLNVKSNMRIEITYASAKAKENSRVTIPEKLFQDVSKESNIEFIHHENDFNDFDREPLVPYQLSKLGPALASGDVNHDGVDDFYVGGAVGQSGQLYIGNQHGHFVVASKQPWNEDYQREDTGATFFDADGDGDLDLFVVSGGNEFPVGSENLDDRLYINNGKGEFVKAPLGSTVADHASGSCVTAADYDKDGDMDLYVGGRLLPGSFPLTTPGAILKNETNKNTGLVKFIVATNEVNAALREPGMVTDALWTDFNNDTWPDLLIVGDWMPIRLFENKQGKLIEVKAPSLENTHGFWNRISSFDFDGDGDTDYVLGNSGSNLSWKVSEQKPLMLYYSDFDGNGRIDPIICYTSQTKSYPVASRDELLLQIPSLRKKFTSYSQFANATVGTILDKPALDNSKKLKVNMVESVALENQGGGKFKVIPLPLSAQVSSVNGILTDDFNHDGFVDILLTGNFYPRRSEYGRSDASMGLLLLGNGKGKFDPVNFDQNGFMAQGDIRNMVFLKSESNSKFILLVRNNDKMSLFDFKRN